nr:hypothetical protein [Alkalicoccus halolimnae]
MKRRQPALFGFYRMRFHDEIYTRITVADVGIMNSGSQLRERDDKLIKSAYYFLALLRVGVVQGGRFMTAARSIVKTFHFNRICKRNQFICKTLKLFEEA